MKNRKRILAAILTAIMTISILPANSFASEAGESDTAEAAVEAVSTSGEEQEVESTVEDAVEAVSTSGEEQEVESTVEDVSEETISESAEETEEPAEAVQADDAGESATTDETVTEEETAAEDETSVEEPAEVVEEALETEAAETEADGPRTLKAEGDDYVVTVTYYASALLPDDVSIEVEEIKETARKYDDYCDQALEAIQEKGSDADKLKYVRLFDIKLVDSTGAKVEPEGTVDVQIRLKDVKKADEAMQVVHFGEEATEVINPDVEGNTLAFETEGFSIYAVLAPEEAGENARLKVIFMNGETEFKTMYVKKADVTNGKLNEVLYDPGEPESAEGKTFLGWTDQSSYNMDTARKTIDDVRTEVAAKLNEGVKEGDTATYYAVMFKAIALYYQDRYENTYRTESLLTTGDDATTTVNQEYTVQGSNPSEGFVGWVVKGTEATEGHTVYKNGDPITISQDTTLIPEIGQGAWLFFDSNAGGAGVSEASYTAPKFIPVGETPTEPAAPTRPGYTFAGWFEGPEDSAATFDFDKQMTEHTAAADGKIYAYAHWTPNPTGSYKVVIWAQKVTDDKNAADSAKTYDYVATYIVNDAVAGTALTEDELRQSSNNYFTKDNAFFGATDLQHGSKAFVYRTFTVDHGIGADGNGVSPDDSTVVNVYYDRALFTIYFTGEPGGETIEHYVPVSGGENVYGLVNDEYVKLTTTVTNKRIVWSKRAGTLDLPSSSLTQVKYGSKSYVYDDSVNVSILQEVGGGNNLIDLGVGRTGYQAFIPGHGGNRYLYTTNSTANSYCQLQWTIAGDYSYTTPDGTTYTGQVYEKQSATGVPYTGLYGQTLEQNGYTWLTPSGSAQSWNELSWLEAFRSDLFGANGLGGIPNVIVAEPETHNTNTTIIFYFEDANNAGQYREVDRVSYYFQQGTNAQYNITERLLGGDFNGYKWSTSDALPSSWEYGIDSNGFTTTRRGNNTFIHIRYKRAMYDIVYMQGNTTLKTESGVPYEASLSDYADTVPADSAVTVGENEFFRGWFEDPEGVKRVDWTGKMPAGNKIIYAVVSKAQYHVVIDMDGGTLPNDQSTEFWEDAGNIIDDTNFKGATKTDDQGNVYTLVGYFLDENYTKQWNFSARLNEEDLWHKYDDTNGDDPYRDSDFFEKGNDVGWYNVSGIFRLFAQWKNEDILSKGGLHIKYVDPEGNTISTDPMHYADKVDVRAADAPADNLVPEDQRFDGWKLKEGKIYQPTEIFIADSEDAVFDPSLGENGEYWITLTAVYVDKEDKTPTHIYFYKNDGVTTEPIQKYDDVDINVGYAICDAPTRDGYEFLGWARDIETPVDEQGNPEIDSETGEPVINITSTKTEADFLEYRDGKYFLPNTNTEVTEVAADEVLPYHGLYAIWKRDQFHIYHSSRKGENAIEDVDMPDEGKTIKLTEYVDGGYLYGGYFHYDKVSEDSEERARGEAYTASGMELSPTAGEYYYLKEVDARHVIPKTYLVINYNHNNLIQGLYAIMDLDEIKYKYEKEGGLIDDVPAYNYVGMEVEVDGEIYDLDIEEMATEGVTFKGKNGKTITSSNLSGINKAVVGLQNLTDLLPCDAEIKIKGYFITCDGVNVYGAKERWIKFPAGDQRYGGMPLFTSWGTTPEDAASGKTATNTTPFGSKPTSVPASNGGRMKVVRMLTVAAPSDDIGYKITKIYDSSTEEQKVQGGDNTGKIDYTPKSGYMFAGWYQDDAYTIPADFSNVTGDMTVYAKFTSNKDVKLAFKRKGGYHNGINTFNVTVTVKNQDQLENVSVNVVDGNSAVLPDKTVKTSGTGKKIKYTTEYKGTVDVIGLSLVDRFTSFVSWTTPDGTTVEGANKKCTYQLGNVTVR